jgi:Xaa-Pro aminopeptidase
VPDVLILGDTARSPELRHEVPVLIGDPFLYVEAGGRRHVVISSMEIPRVRETGAELECHPWEEFGLDELRAQGLATEELRRKVYLRAIEALGITSAKVPFSFPLGYADPLRAQGIELVPDRDFFDARRRVKSEAELAGIRRAQRAAEAGMDAARELLRSDEAARGELTVERVKHAIANVFVAHDTTYDEFIVSHGWQSAIGHHMGEGTIAPGEPVVIDLWPRDNESACFADMTRTFVVGEAPEELRRYHALVKESLDRSFDAIRAGAVGRAVYDASCEPFEREGFPTQRTKTPGQPLDEGYFHGLGHGVGLEVHEEPGLGFSSREELVAGDVVTVEPGLYRTGFGGCRLEDLVVVTEGGCENLTEYPYDLEP